MTKKPFLFIAVIVTTLAFSNTLLSQNNNVITDSVYSETLKEYRHFWVKLPENYNPKKIAKYPVIYLLDGFSLQNNIETVYNNYWGHYLPHMILVGISNRENRTRDLTTSEIKNRRGMAFNYETGGADNFTKFIEKELIPKVDSSYQTTPFRTLIGHSYGGLFTINMLINHSHVFNNYIAIDPSMDWDDQKLLKQAKQKLAAQDFKGKSLFVSLAAEQLHMFDESVTIENLMQDTSEFTLFSRSIVELSKYAESQKQNQLNFYWKVYHEDLHGTVPLPSMRDGLVTLFKWYQFKHPQKYNNPSTTIEEIIKLLNEQEIIYTKKFGYSTPPMVEELFNGYGYMNMQMGNFDKAYLFFKMGVKYYPDSANAYDSLAEYYESQKDYENALENVSKAFEINPNDYFKERKQTVKSKIDN